MALYREKRARERGGGGVGDSLFTRVIDIYACRGTILDQIIHVHILSYNTLVHPWNK